MELIQDFFCTYLSTLRPFMIKFHAQNAVRKIIGKDYEKAASDYKWCKPELLPNYA